MLDIVQLRFIWWVLVGIVLMGFAITDGFDFGAAFLMPFVTRNDTEKRVVLNTIGPFWEGNQVWIILGGGALFAAWPYVYAVAFSTFYLLMLLLLLTMGISRPVSFKYRSKLKNQLWRNTWDCSVFIGGLVPALIFGLLIGNVLTGISFSFDQFLRVSYQGTFLSLFTPFTLLCALTSLSMLSMHGGLYLAIKTEYPIRGRAIYYARISACAFIILFLLGGWYVLRHLPGYVLVSGSLPADPSNPLHKKVLVEVGAWFRNYQLYPLALALPVLGVLGAFIAALFTKAANSKIAFIASAIAIMGVIGTVGVSMFPFILPSLSDTQSSLMIWDASSGALTLLIMLFAVIFFLPIILLYTSWVYRALSGKVSANEIEETRGHNNFY